MSVITTKFKRRRLPHWEVAGKAYFVTFRLRGSLPQKVILQLQAEREAIQTNDTDTLLKFQRHEFYEIEQVLDSVDNDKYAYLSRTDIAPLLMEAFTHLETIYCWRFPVWVIMPNHIHCLCIADKIGKKKSLTEIIALYKRYTAKEINKILGLNGRVWVDENFDHWCRTPEKVESVKRYILNNPVKAGLVEQPEAWAYSSLRFVPSTASSQFSTGG